MITRARVWVEREREGPVSAAWYRIGRDDKHHCGCFASPPSPSSSSLFHHRPDAAAPRRPRRHFRRTLPLSPQTALLINRRQSAACRCGSHNCSPRYDPARHAACLLACWLPLLAIHLYVSLIHHIRTPATRSCASPVSALVSCRAQARPSVTST